MVFMDYLLDVQREKNNVEEKLASLLVLLLGKVCYKILSSLCVRQVVGQSSLFYGVDQSHTKDQQTEHWLIRMNDVTNVASQMSLPKK